MPTPAPQVRHTTPDTAEALWVLGDLVRFMGPLDGTDLVVLEVEAPPGSGTPPHRHPSPEIFRVNAGEVAFGLFGDGPPREVIAGPGAVVTVPSGAGHNYTVRGDRPAVMTVVVDLSLERFFRDVGRVEPPAGPPDAAAVARIVDTCAKHGVEILG